MKAPRIILWDLECSNLSANFGRVLCAGWKVYGEKKVHVISIADSEKAAKDPTEDYDVVKAIAEVLADADIWVTHYGKRFDVPFLNSRLLYHGLPLLPPVPHVDTWETVRKKLKLNNNRLAAVQEFLELEDAKTPIKGPHWVRAAAGNKQSLKYVIDHCRQDIIVLEQAYERLKPLIIQHPSVPLITGRNEGCPHCGSTKLQRRGTQVARTRIYARYQCQQCGAWIRSVESGRYFRAELTAAA